MALITSKDRSELMLTLLVRIAAIAQIRHCAKCGSIRPIEWHHVLGRNNDPKFLAGEQGYIVALCHACHRGRWGIHRAMDQAKVGLQDTTNTAERSLNAWKALLVFLWWLDEQVEPNQKQ